MSETAQLALMGLIIVQGVVTLGAAIWISRQEDTE